MATQEHASDDDTGPLGKVTDAPPTMPALHGELPLTPPPEPAAEPPRERTRWEEPLYVTERLNRDEYAKGQPHANQQPQHHPAQGQPAQGYGGGQYGQEPYRHDPYAAAHYGQHEYGPEGEQPSAPQRTSMFEPQRDGELPAGAVKAKRRSTALKAAALVLVAIVAGLLWWLTHQPAQTQASSQHEQTPTNAQRAGFDFQRVYGPIDDANCAPHAYGAIKQFFVTNKCSSLKQSLFTTKDDAGAPVVSSVSVVTMADPADAKKLKGLTDADGTGNVTDMITGGVRIPDGPKTLKGGGYASKLAGNTVTIVESGYYDGHPNDKTLTKISLGAVTLR